MTLNEPSSGEEANILEVSESEGDTKKEAKEEGTVQKTGGLIKMSDDYARCQEDHVLDLIVQTQEGKALLCKDCGKEH